MQTKREIQSLLESAGLRPRHRFGQNFMIDQNLLRLVADAGKVAAGDFVIEVGPGTGTLTEELLARGAHVLAVEIDHDLAALLRERLSIHEHFRLIEADALSTKHELHPDLLRAIHDARGNRQAVKLVSNLPYNIASPLVINLLIAGVDLLAFTVQKEVAQRLKSAAGCEDYGVLSVMAQLLSDVELLRTLPPQAFWPEPKIESALVRMTRRDQLGASAADFSRFLQSLFSSRRKTVRKGLSLTNVNADEVLGRAGIDGRRRPEELSPRELVGLYAGLAVGR
jgi:16S rRNA (adenine1518-N6/adenine1519-N6)-dimethyltransferase